MTPDPTENIRRSMLEERQPEADLAATTECKYTTDELHQEFTVIGFMAPFVCVTRKSDGKRGTFEFTHLPRVYFNFRLD